MSSAGGQRVGKELIVIGIREAWPCEIASSNAAVYWPCPAPTPALFLDRDWALIEDKNHFYDPLEVVLCSGVKTLPKNAKQKHLLVVAITNQSCIARGYFDWKAYEQLTDRVLELLGTEAPLAAIYANGHGPDGASSSWRKPSPAMHQAAAADLQIDLTRSLLICNRLSDLRAGSRAGLAWLGHVQTGHGQRERPAVEHWDAQR